MMTDTSMAAEIFSNVRIQVLAPYVVRIEQKGPRGFEDRASFTVPGRHWAGAAYEVEQKHGHALITTPHFRINLAGAGETFAGIRIESPAGKLLHKLNAKDLANRFLPAPSALPNVWILADAPRVIPPAWGALPPPPSHQEDAHSGWDLENQAPDLYVFFPRASGYEQFRQDFLRLTGAVPLPPLFAFGLWYSRYHPYDEDTALQVIKRFRSSQIPLDVFVVDTDWRVGASCGYEINQELFPDMGRFLAKAHAEKVRIMLNDHPEPKGPHALAPQELKYRQQGLESLLKLGADVWWFDRNWHVHLQAPVAGLNKEVWGMCLYHDVTLQHAPQRRPLIMSNVEGINNGQLETPSHPAAHRYPIWWTGDTIAEWKYLRWGVENSVDGGIQSLLPYVHEDLGGHHGQPDAEYFIRFMQFGAFACIARIHSTRDRTRYPWQYDQATEQIVGDFFRLRYRLLPTLYTAAYEAHHTGMPIQRRCDLEWPDEPEARDNTQYLIGPDLLVAPILEQGNAEGLAQRQAWIPPGEWEDAWTGHMYSGPQTITVEQPVERIPLFIRQGGVVVTWPQIQHTQEASWNKIVLDAYVTVSDDEQLRLLYEDDGISNGYLSGGFGLTQITLARRAHDVKLTIEPSAMHTHFQAPEKTWVVRLHLPAGAKVGAVQLDGNPLPASQYHVLRASAGPSHTLFAGAGTPPPPAAGDIVELVFTGPRGVVSLALSK